MLKRPDPHLDIISVSQSQEHFRKPLEITHQHKHLNTGFFAFQYKQRNGTDLPITDAPAGSVVPEHEGLFDQSPSLTHEICTPLGIPGSDFSYATVLLTAVAPLTAPPAYAHTYITLNESELGGQNVHCTLSPEATEERSAISVGLVCSTTMKWDIKFPTSSCLSAVISDKQMEKVPDARFCAWPAGVFPTPSGIAFNSAIAEDQWTKRPFIFGHSRTF